MVIRLKRFASVLDILEKVGRCVGKTFIQKSIYILQEGLDEPLRYDYRLYFYGPYSQELANDIDTLSDLGLIDIEYSTSGYGYQIKLTEYGKRFLHDHLQESLADGGKIEKVISLIGGSATTKSMELLGTVLYFTKISQDRSEIVSLVKMVKPHFTDRDVESALKKLKSGGLI